MNTAQRVGVNCGALSQNLLTCDSEVQRATYNDANKRGQRRQSDDQTEAIDRNLQPHKQPHARQQSGRDRSWDEYANDNLAARQDAQVSRHRRSANKAALPLKTTDDFILEPRWRRPGRKFFEKLGKQQNVPRKMDAYIFDAPKGVMDLLHRLVQQARFRGYIPGELGDYSATEVMAVGVLRVINDMFKNDKVVPEEVFHVRMFYAQILEDNEYTIDVDYGIDENEASADNEPGGKDARGENSPSLLPSELVNMGYEDDGGPAQIDNARSLQAGESRLCHSMDDSKKRKSPSDHPESSKKRLRPSASIEEGLARHDQSYLTQDGIHHKEPAGRGRFSPFHDSTTSSSGRHRSSQHMPAGSTGTQSDQQGSPGRMSHQPEHQEGQQTSDPEGHQTPENADLPQYESGDSSWTIGSLANQGPKSSQRESIEQPTINNLTESGGSDRNPSDQEQNKGHEQGERRAGAGGDPTSSGDDDSDGEHSDPGGHRQHNGNSGERDGSQQEHNEQEAESVWGRWEQEILSDRAIQEAALYRQAESVHQPWVSTAIELGSKQRDKRNTRRAELKAQQESGSISRYFKPINRSESWRHWAQYAWTDVCARCHVRQKRLYPDGCKECTCYNTRCKWKWLCNGCDAMACERLMYDAADIQDHKDRHRLVDGHIERNETPNPHGRCLCGADSTLREQEGRIDLWDELDDPPAIPIVEARHLVKLCGLCFHFIVPAGGPQFPDLPGEGVYAPNREEDEEPPVIIRRSRRLQNPTCKSLHKAPVVDLTSIPDEQGNDPEERGSDFDDTDPELLMLDTHDQVISNKGDHQRMNSHGFSMAEDEAQRAQRVQRARARREQAKAQKEQVKAEEYARLHPSLKTLALQARAQQKEEKADEYARLRPFIEELDMYEPHLDASHYRSHDGAWKRYIDLRVSGQIFERPRPQAGDLAVNRARLECLAADYNGVWRMEPKADVRWKMARKDEWPLRDLVGYSSEPVGFELGRGRGAVERDRRRRLEGGQGRDEDGRWVVKEEALKGLLEEGREGLEGRESEPG